MDLAGQWFFSIIARTQNENSINDRGERVVINHPSPRRDVKSKIIYELISALARALTKRVSVCLSWQRDGGLVLRREVHARRRHTA